MNVRTNSAYDIKLNVNIKGKQQNIVIQVYDYAGPIVSKAQCYENTDLELALNAEFQEILKVVAKDIKV